MPGGKRHGKVKDALGKSWASSAKHAASLMRAMGGGGQPTKDWKVQAPKAASSILQYGAANVSSTNRGVRIRHSELCRAVSGSTGFNAEVISLNPGLLTSFPWLAAIANSYETYKVHSCALRYVPRVSANTAGLVLMSAEYNSGDPTAYSGPTSESQMSTTPGAVECPAWASATFRVDPSRFNYPKYFTRLTRVEDPEIYDPAQLYIATNNCADTSAIGRIYIEYDIEFMVPQLIHAVAPAPCKVSAYQAVSKIIPTPTSVMLDWAANFNPLNVTMAGTTDFYLEPGAYLIDVTVQAYVPTSTSGCAGVLNVILNGAQLSLHPNFGWAKCKANFVPSTLVSADLHQSVHVRGIILIESNSDLLQFQYEAAGTTAGNHVIQVAGSTVTIQTA